MTTSVEIDAEYKKATAALTQDTAAYEAAVKARYAATKELEAQIAQIAKPLDATMHAAEAQKQRTQDTVSKLNDAYTQAKAKETYASATTLTEEVAQAFLIASGIAPYHAKPYHESYGEAEGFKVVKAKTENGLTVLMEKDYDHSRYWLFNGVKCVAVWTRRKPTGFNWDSKEPSYAHLNGAQAANRYMNLAEFKKEAKDARALPTEIISLAIKEGGQ